MSLEPSRAMLKVAHNKSIKKKDHDQLRYDAELDKKIESCRPRVQLDNNKYGDFMFHL